MQRDNSSDTSQETEKKKWEEKALKLLKDPDLMNRLVKAVQDNKNIVDEKLAIETIIVICTGCKVKNRATTSTNMAFDTSSGAGKDFIIDGVRFTLFRKQWQKYSNPTPTAIIYGQVRHSRKVKEGKEEIYKEFTENKPITSDTILYIKDASQRWLDHDDNKLLMEDDEINITKKTPKGRVKNIRFSKPIIFISTAETSIKNQIIRRLPNISLDESDVQTEKIIKIQQAEDSFETKGHFNEDIRIVDIAMSCLKKVDVSLEQINTYMDKKRPKSNNLEMRTFNKRMQDYIKFYAALHQFQRKEDNNGRILANMDDVDNGIKLFNYIYLRNDKKIKSFNSRQRTIYNHLKTNEGKKYSVSDINELKGVNVSKPILYRDIKHILKETDIKVEGNNPKVYYYPKQPIEIELEIIED